MADIYLSYAQQDLELAEALARFLETQGYTVWWDRRDLRPGDDFSATITAEIERAAAVIVLWTPHSLSSEWVRAEADMGRERDKLVALRTADLQVSGLAPGPSIDLVDDRPALLAALHNLGVVPRAAPAPVTPSTQPSPSASPPAARPSYSARAIAAAAAAAAAPLAAASKSSSYDELVVAPLPASGTPALSARHAMELRGLVSPAASPATPAPAAAPTPPDYADLEAAEFGAAAPPRPSMPKRRTEAQSWEAKPQYSAPMPTRSRSSPAATISGLALLAVVAGAAYVFRERLVDISSQLLAVLGLVKGAMPPGPAPAQPAETQTDLVDCSVFAPPRTAPGTRIMVQAYLHLVEQAERVAFLATTMDDNAKLRGVQTLQAPIARGAHVRLVLDGQGLVVDEPIQALVWRGEPNVAAFSCEVPSDARLGEIHPVVRLFVGDEPVGRILFKLQIAAPTRGHDLLPGPELTGTSARRYRQAFLSYASEDRVEVLKRAQALRLANISLFQDILSLEPGERYERRLYEKIDEADIFMLFWSRHARASKWVAKEIEYARSRQLHAPDALPDIVPVVLDDPRDAPPPELLGDRHFNDTIAALISYEEARKTGSAWSWLGFRRRR